MIDKIQISKTGHVLIREIMPDGSYSRRTVAPGDDYTAELVAVRVMCKKAHTADVIDAHRAAQNAEVL